MKKEEFRNWLINEKGFKVSTVASRISNVMRLDAAYDVDKQYKADKLEGLMETLDDAIVDAKNGMIPDVDVKIDGSYASGLHSLKSSLKLYKEFGDSVWQDSKSKRKNKESVWNGCFVGEADAFKRYIKPAYRNLVNYWAGREKEKLNGICEYCGQKKVLEAAHKEGWEFVDIIERILDENYSEGNNIYKVDLNEFENKLHEAHDPKKNIFFFLCKECHNKYDKEKSITTEMLENVRKGKK